MLPFRPINISDKKACDEIIKPLNSLLCAHCFVDLFIWKGAYDTQICIKDGFVLLKQRLGDETIYTFPLGKGDTKKAIEDLIQDAEDRGVEFNLAAINKEQKEELEKILPDSFEFVVRRDSQDYIYTSESLMTLSGKKLHSKRNFINRFKSENEGNWEYEDITKENIHEVFEYHLSWCALNKDNEDDDFFNETCAISLALKNMEKLELKGGLLRLNGKVIAFTLGSRANEEMFIVHIEKADYTVSGSYQMINNQFALHNFEGIKYIDREEDLGLEGLRKAKLSYNPIMLSDNYSAVIKLEVANATKMRT